ncbi:bifunctional phosphopantothenoylcysteine decarboxylase/phosphopantothenate--cysteine ligase CoaBC [bacterium]|nr:bifunctional phosphopantothenoylcysteine decarboxylase/phosphopantothenate--cysteine ligase CoaBC [bacterium]
MTNKKVVVCVSGGIAVYKACELVRLLKKANCEVKVAMTKNAMEFVNPTTFEVLSQNEVFTSVFPENKRKDTYHIELARWADLVLIVPATANIIGKIANGIADDIVTTTLTGTKSPVIFAPAMNDFMFENSAVQQNIQKLKSFGYLMIPPGFGELACGIYSIGRLAEPEIIFAEVEKFFKNQNLLLGKKILITAGPTREFIDPVRFISNPSTGKMGFAIAEQSQKMGAEVTLVSGKVSIPFPNGVKLISVTTAEEMLKATSENYEKQDVVIFTAAVGDYKPKTISTEKIKKSEENLTIELVKNVDVAYELGKIKKGKIHVGFAVETENEIANSQEKLKRKNFDFIVCNNPKIEGSAFSTPTNKVTFVFGNGKTEELPLLPKEQVALAILEKIFPEKF